LFSCSVKTNEGTPPELLELDELLELEELEELFELELELELDVLEEPEELLEAPGKIPPPQAVRTAEVAAIIATRSESILKRLDLEAGIAKTPRDSVRPLTAGSL
jgi:hypothetical protein